MEHIKYCSCANCTANIAHVNMPLAATCKVSAYAVYKSPQVNWALNKMSFMSSI